MQCWATTKAIAIVACPPTVNGCAIAELPLGGGSGYMVMALPSLLSYRSKLC